MTTLDAFERQHAELLIKKRIGDRLGSRIDSLDILMELQRIQPESMVLTDLSIETTTLHRSGPSSPRGGGRRAVVAAAGRKRDPAQVNRVRLVLLIQTVSQPAATDQPEAQDSLLLPPACPAPPVADRCVGWSNLSRSGVAHPDEEGVSQPATAFGSGSDYFKPVSPVSCCRCSESTACSARPIAADPFGWLKEETPQKKLANFWLFG